jgi:hypothetical protein
VHGVTEVQGLEIWGAWTGGLGQGVPMIVLTYMLTMEPGGPLTLRDRVLPPITVEISPH